MDNHSIIYALITRASSTIGESFARILAMEGYNLVLVDTHIDKLQNVAQIVKKDFPLANTICISKNLEHDSDSQELYKEVQQNNLNVELLINNEEIEYFAKNEEIKNYAGKDGSYSNNKFLKHPLTILFLKEMMRKNKGKILHFVSTINRARTIYFSQHNFDKPMVFSLVEIFQHKISEKLIELNILNAQIYSIKLNASDDLDLRAD
ncbi:SDR family NAD(P)-dependent oxidoreductase [Runella slithyformis]|uniref:SDR family NAD(P)-dependent oxidoreductase n=1 Tax=Runella slithyformis (strain ATCC 29530 / DSM 19594 / LMG 11500 / NCIMB 11436 / LSU 4) TaxID=761193 RepID=A0A7U3ZRY9_RUNSL|nr:SDR family NAD(P)-dependent oxidoreductase [Runella slithyformis]AEI52252.1 hypothetical protein Runsl_5767 [Runella slithyformis DSM 19594]